MKSGHPHICLYKPEIPQNTGNIARLAAATGCRLDLILPFGFTTEDKQLRRPGLDYWPFLDVELFANLDELLMLYADNVVFLSKHASARCYTEIPASTEVLIFGQETKGLPEELHLRFPDKFYHIPMFHTGVRSLNLANAVSVVVYDQLRKRKCFV